MTGLLQSIPFILLALVGVTIIDTAGAIASRRLNFNYGYLTIFSLTVYTLMGYHVSGVAGITMVLSSSLVVGFYDATVGWKLSKFCRANLGALTGDEHQITTTHALMAMLVVAPVFAYLGHALR